MRVDLPSGHHAELRDVDQLMAADDRVAKAAFKLTVQEDGSRELTGDLTDRVRRALLKQLIVSWDFPGLPIPRDAVDPDGVLDSLGLKDLKELRKAIEPAYNEVMEVEEDPKKKETPAQNSVTAS